MTGLELVLVGVGVLLLAACVLDVVGAYRTQWPRRGKKP